ncbi:Hypothetical predicted protein, partial [Marmota monax]
SLHLRCPGEHLPATSPARAGSGVGFHLRSQAEVKCALPGDLASPDSSTQLEIKELK